MNGISLKDVPALRLSLAGYSIDLRIQPDHLRELMSLRYCASPCDTPSDFEVIVAEYHSEHSDFAVISPFGIGFAKGGEKLYFGSKFNDTAAILAGSLGGDDMASPDEVLQCFIEAEIIGAITKAAHCLNFVHAASVARNGKAVLLAGPSGSGKSTLAIACAMRGFELLGDDVACVDFERMLAFSYPRNPRVRDGGKRLLAEFGGRVPDIAAPCIERRIYAICILYPFEPNPKLTRIDGMDKFWQFCTYSVVNVRHGQAAIRIATALSGLACYQLAAGSLEATTAVLAGITD